VKHLLHVTLNLSPGMRNGLIIFGSLVAVSLVVFIWAACIRKKPRRRKYRYHQSKGATAIQDEAEAAPAPAEPVRRKWRRPRSGRRLLNPTLAETRGLPPLRSRHTPPQGL
jgi:hypothetical protein